MRGAVEHIPLIAAAQAELEFWRQRQLGAHIGDRKGEGRVQVDDFRVVPGERAEQAEVGGGEPGEITLDTADLRIAGVIDDGEEVDILRVDMAHLHAVPLDVVSGAIEAQATVHEFALPAELVVHQFIRLVDEGNAVFGCARDLAGCAAIRLGGDLTAGHGAVEALWTETLGPCGIEHQVVRLAPAQGQAVNRIVHRCRLEVADIDYVVAPAGHIGLCYHIRVVGRIAIGEVRHRTVAVFENGKALKARFQVVVAEAVSKGEILQEVEGQLTEHRNLLFRARDVVGKLGGCAALVRVIGDQWPAAAVQLAGVWCVPVRVAVVEVTDVLQLDVLIENTALEANPARGVGVEAQFVGGALHFVADGGKARATVGALDHVWIAGKRGVEGVAHAATAVVARCVVLTHVAGDVEAGVRVVGVVDDLVCFALQVGAGIEQLQFAQATLQGPGGLREVFGEAVRMVALHLKVAHFGIVVEHAVCIQLLLVVSKQQVPVVVDQVFDAGAEALIRGVVEVFLCQRIVVTRLILHAVGAPGFGVAAIGELVSGRVAAAGGEHHAISRGQGGVARGVGCERASYIVDITALTIIEDQYAGRQTVFDQRKVEDGAGVGAGVALRHERSASLERG